MVEGNAERPFYGPDRSRMDPAVKGPADCGDVFDLLDHNVRQRPGMWMRDGSLLELESILFGYSIALQVHSVPEEFELSPTGSFARWLRAKHGWGMTLGWASAIEQHLRDGETAVEAFFRLLDDYRDDKESRSTGQKSGA